MSGSYPPAWGASGRVHPVVLDRRIRDLLLVALGGVVAPAALALGLTVALPNVNVLLVLAVIGGLVGVVALMKSARLELTATVLAIYLLMMDGPVKLGLSGHEETAVTPDILIGAVCLGALLRILVRRERVRMPPLAAWVLAFVGIVLVEAFNPKTDGILHALGGLRQQLQWVPFFFFGYVLMRSKKRLRLMFIVVGVAAVANAVVSTYQAKLSPTTLASWGPGYRKLYQPVSVGDSAKHARVAYTGEGEAQVRPTGLGSDSGFSGGVGMLALPFSLALLATWRSRRRWLAIVFALGGLAGVISGLGRLQVVGALLGVVIFLALAKLAGQAKRPLMATLVVLALALPLAVGYVSLLRGGTFARYGSLENASPEALATHKSKAYTLIPHELETVPFGVGLGTTGPVAGFGGADHDELNGHVVSAETQWNMLADEVGAPGLILWAVLSIYVLVIAARGLRTIRDPDLAILLAAACAPFATLLITGWTGPFETSSALGTYFWFAIGIVAYWFAGRRRLPAPAPARMAGALGAVGAS